MTASGLLIQLRSLGVELSVTGDRLRYKAPAGVMTPALCSEVSRQKVELLAFLSATDKEADAIVPLKRVDRTGPLPLSFSQEQMWFLNQLSPGDPFYNITAALRMRGEVNEEALRNSLQAIVDRHEILRTSFPTIDDKPVQSISPFVSLNLEVVDLTSLASVERQSQAQRLANEEARRAFDLSRGPVLRAKLLRVSGNERVLILSLHHIVADAWSMGIILKEMCAFYEAEMEGRKARLEELAVQYADYAVWQRERMKGEWLEGELRYWREKLGVGAEVSEVETDRARPGVQKHRGKKVRLEISPELRDEMKEMSRREGLTEYMVMMGGLEVMLSRMSGEEEVRIGTAVANRNQWELEDGIGMYANTVIRVGDLRGNPTMKEVMRRVKEEVIEGMGHEEVAYEKVVEELRPEREASREGVIGVMFVMKRREEEVRMRGIEIEEMEIEEGVAKFDVKVEVEEIGERMRVELEYDEELYEGARMERMMKEYEKVIEVVVTDPGRRLWDLPELVTVAKSAIRNEN